MKKTLNTLRVPDNLNSKMLQAQKKLNQMNITELPFAEFRRTCYDFFSKFVLQETPDKIRKVLQKK